MENKKKVVLSETDVAYQILREKKEPMHYRELIIAVLERMGQDTAISGTKLAQIHTEINLDSRLDFLGKGMWGLLAWAPKPASKLGADGPNERSYQPKAADYIWDEEADEDLEEEEECLVPDDEAEAVDDDDEEDADELVIDEELLDDAVEDLAEDEVEDLAEDEEEDEPEN